MTKCWTLQTQGICSSHNIADMMIFVSDRISPLAPPGWLSGERVQTLDLVVVSSIPG